VNPIEYLRAFKIGLTGVKPLTLAAGAPEGVETITPAPGDKFEVAIPIDGDKPFHGLGFYVSWPACVKPLMRKKTGSEEMEPTWAPGDIWAGRSLDAAVNLPGDGSRIYVSLSVDKGQQPVVGDGKNFVTLTFEASDVEGEGSIYISDVKPLRWKADGTFERLTCEVGAIENHFAFSVEEPPYTGDDGTMIVRVVVRKI
jgi:hypothetical protein